MTASARGESEISLPSDLEILHVRALEASIELVFDVLTKPEHVAKTIAPFGEVVTVCSIDLRVGGRYRYVFLTPDGVECSFRGTFLEVAAPTRTVQTWRFDGWPDVEAIETVDLSKDRETTTLSYRLTFPDMEARRHMSQVDGLEANFDNIEKYVRSLTT